MSKAYQGACMCGAVKFSFSAAPMSIKDCVCESCRRAHGASAVAWVQILTPQFSLDAGESLCWYQSSAESERGFCANCGTMMLFRSRKWPGETHMALACITPPHDLVSIGVSFREELPTWTALTVKDNVAQ